jgi:hypothetical protein
MKYVRLIWWTLALTTTLLACQTADPSTPFSQPPVKQTVSPDLRPQNSATPVFRPTLTQEVVTMVPVTPPNEDSEKMVALVKQHLAQRLSIPVDQIVLSEIQPVVWRDGGLGCPKPGIDYIRVETPGYSILLKAGGNTYSYHTDETKRFVQCNP